MIGRERMHAATGDEVLRNKRFQVLRLFAIVSALMAGLAIVLGAISSDARAQDAPQYTFTKVLDSADGYDPFGFECTAINSRGDIAIRTARVDPEDEFNTSEVIVRANAAGGGLTTIVDEEADGTRFIGRNPEINDTGDVSFAARLPGSRNEIIARGRGGPLTVIARTQPSGEQPGAYDSFGFDTSINNRGEVSFRGELDNGDLGLWSGRGGAITTHYLNSNSEFGGSFAGTSINNDGLIAFDESVGFDSGIFRGANGSFVTIASDPDHFVQQPAMNSSGVVAFYDSFFDEETFDFVESIVTGSGGPLTTVADTNGDFGSFGHRPPSINNDGQVAFNARLDDFVTQGIFVGPDPVADRVVGSGDTIAGETWDEMILCGEGLNNSGQLAFTAFSEDPNTFELHAAVFRATPVP